jgi:hypothetical protein
MTDSLTVSCQYVVSPRHGPLDRMESWRAERDQFDVVHWVEKKLETSGCGDSRVRRRRPMATVLMKNRL